jgi:hypothetical protein
LGGGEGPGVGLKQAARYPFWQKALPGQKAYP